MVIGGGSKLWGRIVGIVKGTIEDSDERSAMGFMEVSEGRNTRK
jgi:hypothetical protein